MATEVDPARGNQDGPNVDPAYGNQDEPNTALGVSSNPATGPPQSDISTPIASSQGDTLGSESTSPKIDPTEISAVTSASTGLTSRGDEVPTKEQKPDGPTVVSVANDNCATDDLKRDVPQLINQWSTSRYRFCLTLFRLQNLQASLCANENIHLWNEFELDCLERAARRSRRFVFKNNVAFVCHILPDQRKGK